MLHEQAPRVEGLPAPCDSSSPPTPLVSAPLGSRVSAPLVSTYQARDPRRRVPPRRRPSGRVRAGGGARGARPAREARLLSELTDCPVTLGECRQQACGGAAPRRRGPRVADPAVGRRGAALLRRRANRERARTRGGGRRRARTRRRARARAPDAALGGGSPIQRRWRRDPVLGAVPCAISWPPPRRIDTSAHGGRRRRRADDRSVCARCGGQLQARDRLLPVGGQAGAFRHDTSTRPWHI